MDETLPTILCADDDPEALERLQEHFGQQGFVVLTATNGVEACLQAKRWHPKAAILDLFIPRLGGIGVLARVRAFDPAMPVILVGDSDSTVELVVEAGLGATAAFTKPLDLKRVSETLARAGVMPPAGLAELDGPAVELEAKRPRILLVDDQPEFRAMLAEYLDSKGYEIAEAGSGEEALVAVAEFHPRIVLLDVMMAGIGGLEALAGIKARHPETCVIMVTALEDLDTARQALAA